jgi:histone H3/H4
MVPKKKHETMVRLAQALSATRGLNSSRQVKDSDHAMLSSQTLSRLLGNLTQQLDIQINAYNKLRELEAKRDSLLVEYNTNTTLEARRTIIADELKILN